MCLSLDSIPIDPNGICKKKSISLDNDDNGDHDNADDDIDDNDVDDIDDIDDNHLMTMAMMMMMRKALVRQGDSYLKGTITLGAPACNLCYLRQ